MWYVTADGVTVGPFASDMDANDWLDANAGNKRWELYYEGNDNV